MAEHFAIAVLIDNFVLVSPLFQSSRPTLLHNMSASSQSIGIVTNILWPTVEPDVMVEKPPSPA
jgi:hypothetical protein